MEIRVGDKVFVRILKVLEIVVVVLEESGEKMNSEFEIRAAIWEKLTVPFLIVFFMGILICGIKMEAGNPDQQNLIWLILLLIGSGVALVFCIKNLFLQSMSVKNGAFYVNGMEYPANQIDKISIYRNVITVVAQEKKIASFEMSYVNAKLFLAWADKQDIVIERR